MGVLARLFRRSRTAEEASTAVTEAGTAATESGTEKTDSAEEATEAKDSAGAEGMETAAAAEVFAAALNGNGRAELVGERTLGRAARQQLVTLPDGSGLLLSSMRYLTPANAGIHERGLTPDVQVRQPDVEFGAQPPAKDETLDTALARLAEKKAA